MVEELHEICGVHTCMVKLFVCVHVYMRQPLVTGGWAVAMSISVSSECALYGESFPTLIGLGLVHMFQFLCN